MEENSEMNPLIRKQLFDFFIMFYSGLAVMLFYQIYEAYQRRFHPRGFLLLLEELLFWLFASLLVTSFLYYSGYGAISFHSMIALLCGACAWRFFFGRKISGILHYCSRSTYGIMKHIRNKS